MYFINVNNGKVAKITGVDKCTGVNSLGKTKMIVMEGISIHIYEERTKIKSIDISQKND